MILTGPLRDWLVEHHKGFGKRLKEVPICKAVLLRLRRLLALDVERWWLDREADLQTLTPALYAERHKVSVASAGMWRRRLGLPRHIREPRLYLEPQPLAEFTSATPRCCWPSARS